MARLGMDADQVAAAGRALKERAGEIDALVARIDGIVRGLPGVWDGPRSQQFVQEWWPAQKKSLVTASSHVAGLGQSAMNNATEQREVSGAGSGSGGDRGGAKEESQLSEWRERIETMVGHTLTGVEMANLARIVKGGAELPVLEKITGPLGILLEGKEFVSRVQDGNYAASVVNLLSGGSSLGALAGFGALGPVSVGLSALSAFVDITLPVSGEEQDQTIAMGSQHLFHKAPGELTPQQSQQLANRYNGVLGPVMMISDTMDATAKKIFPWNWGKK